MNSITSFFLHQWPWKMTHHQPFYKHSFCEEDWLHPISIVSLLKWTNAVPSIFVHWTCLPDLLSFTWFVLRLFFTLGSPDSLMGVDKVPHQFWTPTLEWTPVSPKQVVIIASGAWQRALLLIQSCIQWGVLQQPCRVDSYSTCEPEQPRPSPDASLCIPCFVFVYSALPAPEECFALVLISSLLLSGRISHLYGLL